MQWWSAWLMMFLGQGCSCSVPPAPKHREKEKLMKQRHCVCEGLYGGTTYWLCWSWEASISCRSQRGWGKLVLRAELPGKYIAAVFHSLQGLLHKDVSSLEMMQLSARHLWKTSCGCLESSSNQPDLNLYPAVYSLSEESQIWESLMAGEASCGGRWKGGSFLPDKTDNWESEQHDESPWNH